MDFADISIKGRSSGGNIVSKFPLKRIDLKESGVSTLGARKVWYDETVRRLNGEGRGMFLGDFHADDKILALHSDGVYVLTGFDFSTHFDDKMISVEKWDADRPLSVIYFDGEKEDWFVKRFLPEASSKPVCFITEHEGSRLAFATSFYHPRAIIKFNKRFKNTRDREDEVIDVRGFIAVKGVKALGNKLNSLPVTDVLLEAPNVELEESTKQDILEARKIDEAVADVVEEADIVQEDDVEPPFSDDGQASLF